MHSVSYFLVAAFHLEMNCSGSANSLYSPAIYIYKAQYI
jgi:hypothetical protein